MDQAQKEAKKTVGVFAWASFLNDFGSDMIYSVWPLFVTGVLGADMKILGLIDGLGDAIVSVSQAVSGYLSDKLKKRKVFIWVGYACGMLSRLGYATVGVWGWLIPFRILDRAGKMRGAPRDAIIADLSERSNRAKSFGILRAMDNLGAVCGILFSIAFFAFLGYRNLFLIAAIPSAISVILIFLFVKERGTEKKVFKGFVFEDASVHFKMFLLLSSIFSLGSFSYSFLLIYAKQFGFQTTFIPILYLLFTAVAFATSIPFGKLADAIGRKSVLYLSFLSWGLVCVAFIVLQSTIAIVISFVMYGLHRGAMDTVQRTLVSELAPKEFRASGLGGFQMVIGLCALPASFIAGLLWDSISVSAPFYFSLFLTIISSILLLLVKEETVP